MNFTLKQLRYAEAAGRLGSIAGAAAELSISQSSITAAIDALEVPLGYDFFVRTPAKGIRPTPAGDEALDLIRTFINQVRHFEAELQSIGGDATGHVRIACYATAAPAFLPPILMEITERFPEMSVQVLEGNLATVSDFLSEGKADLVFTYKQGLQQNFDFLQLFKAPPYALINLDDPLSNQESVTFSELAERPMVLLELPLTREYFTGLFLRRGCRPNIAHTTRSAEIARTLVESGFGYTILNIRPLETGPTNVRYKAVPISDAPTPQEFGIATLRGTREPKIVRAFIECCVGLLEAGAFEALTVWPPDSKKTIKSSK